MFISRKRFEAMVEERVNQEMSRKDYERYIDDRFRHVYERLNAIEDKINPHWREEEAIKPNH